MKTIFDAEQPAIRIIEDGGRVYAFIALNGGWIDRKLDESLPTQRVWECDYREIVTEKGAIDLEDLKKHPEKYLNWTEPSKKEIGERVEQIEDEITAIKKAAGDQPQELEKRVATVEETVEAVKIILMGEDKS